MQVQDVMTKGTVVVEPGASLLDAASRMKASDVGFLAVVSGTQAVGAVTDRDIVVRGIAAGMDPKSARVEQVMSKGAFSCQADDDVLEAIRVLESRKVRRLLVLDSRSKPVGVLSLGDLAAKKDTRDMSCEVLSQVCGEVTSRHTDW